jgi:transposase
MHSDDKKESFIELRAAGNSFDKIASKIKVSKPTLIKWSRELATDIKNSQAIRIDCLREEYIINKEERLKRLKRSLLKVTEALEKRDLADVPTLKLIELEEQFIIRIKNELKVTLKDTVDPMDTFTLGSDVTWEA